MAQSSHENTAARQRREAAIVPPGGRPMALAQSIPQGETMMRLARAALLLPLTAAPAFALDMPPRKAGLWELKMSLRRPGHAATDPALHRRDDRQADEHARRRHAADQCSKQDVQRSGNTITIDSVCNFGTGTTTSRAVVTGELQFRLYGEGEVEARRRAAVPGMPAETNMTIEAKWIGAVQGRSEARRHDHGQRHEDEHQRHGEGRHAGAPADEEVVLLRQKVWKPM